MKKRPMFRRLTVAGPGRRLPAYAMEIGRAGLCIVPGHGLAFDYVGGLHFEFYPPRVVLTNRGKPKKESK